MEVWYKTKKALYIGGTRVNGEGTINIFMWKISN